MMSIQTRTKNKQPMINDPLLAIDKYDARNFLEHRLPPLLSTSDHVEKDESEEDDASEQHMVLRWGVYKRRTNAMTTTTTTTTTTATGNDSVSVQDRVRAELSKLFMKVALAGAVFSPESSSMSGLGQLVVGQPGVRANNDEQEMGLESLLCSGGSGGCVLVQELGAVAQWVAILLMMMGMYLRVKCKTLSKVLEVVGQLIFVVGLMSMQPPFTHLSCIYLCIMSLVVFLILGVVMIMAD